VPSEPSRAWPQRELVDWGERRRKIDVEENDNYSVLDRRAGGGGVSVDPVRKGKTGLSGFPYSLSVRPPMLFLPQSCL
jgi:hypothetical protein